MCEQADRSNAAASISSDGAFYGGNAVAVAFALFRQVHGSHRHDAVCGAWNVRPGCLPAHSLSSSL